MSSDGGRISHSRGRKQERYARTVLYPFTGDVIAVPHRERVYRARIAKLRLAARWVAMNCPAGVAQIDWLPTREAFDLWRSVYDVPETYSRDWVSRFIDRC